MFRLFVVKTSFHAVGLEPDLLVLVNSVTDDSSGRCMCRLCGARETVELLLRDRPEFTLLDL